jgi:CHAD domain-containing protein
MARRRSGSHVVEDFITELERRLDVTLRELDRLVATPRPTPSALHRFHRDLRRLRVGMGLWGRLLPKSRREEMAAYSRRVKRLARLVGGVRDRDVTLDLLGDQQFLKGSREKSQVEETRARLLDDAQVGRELLRVFLRSERDAGLFVGIRESLHRPPAASRVRNLDGYLRRIQDDGRREVQQAHRRARRKPSTRRLHRLRIRVRDWRHLNDLSSTLVPVGSSRPSSPLRALQRRLGRLHDLEVAANLAKPAQGTRWARSIVREQHRQRRRIVQQLRARRTREVVPVPEGAA